MERKPSEGLNRNEIIRKSDDFRKVFSRGKKRRTEHFTIYTEKTEGCTRFGLTVSRKVGNAVVRNSVKRKLREYFRKNKGRFENTSTVIVALRGSGLIKTETVREEISEALQK